MVGDFNSMKPILPKIREEIERGHIGSNLSCEYYPCHYEGQDCSFCYCPFYPCSDDRLGLYIITKKRKKVWDCSPCLMIHDTAVAKEIYRLIDEMGITEPDDPRFRNIFERVSAMYLESSAGGDSKGNNNRIR